MLLNREAFRQKSFPHKQSTTSQQSVVLIDQFRVDLNKLTKEKLSSILGNPQLNARKCDLIDYVIKAIWGNELELHRFYMIFALDLALSPSEVETRLKCTTAERKLWTVRGYLKVLETRAFTKYGKQIKYPVFDAYQVNLIPPELIGVWRAQAQEEKAMHLAAGSEKAKLTKQQHDSQREAFDREWKETVASWFKVDPCLGATLQLAYWTVWISRWAKEYQLKTQNAVTKGEEYERNAKEFYTMKNEAIKLLAKSPYVELSFYRPENPVRTTLHLCDVHYEEWREVRSNVGYMNKLDYLNYNGENIKKCPRCTYSKEQDYYSLYYLEVKDPRLPEYRFSFHTPFPIGKGFLPPEDVLPKVNHVEQADSMFRFGRTLYSDEKVVYTEKTVRKQFEGALAKLKLYVG